MSENTLLNNGRLLHNLNGWTASLATYSAGDGDEHYGVAVIPVGGYIEQSFGVTDVRAYTLHSALKPIGSALVAGEVTIVIYDGDNNAVATLQPAAVQDVWTEFENTLGLAPGTNYRIRITNVSQAGGVRVDDLWLWYVPITRARIAQEVHDKLGRLASERKLYPTPTGVLTEGSYTRAVSAALRTLGAINPETGEPDVRYINPGQVQNVLDAVRVEMLEHLHTDFAVEVDSSVGPYSQSLSQKREAIGDILGVSGGGAGGASGSGPVIQRRMDYD